MSSRIDAFKNSLNGLRLAWADDQSFRNTACQGAAGFVIATGITLYTHANIMHWLLLVGSLFPMVIIETVNTSIEAVTDKASPERHPLAKRAKDIGSSAVLLSRIFALMCWAVALTHIF